MNVTLSPQLEALIREKIETGPYENANEVIREALLLLDERDRQKRLKASLADADQQIERGEYDEWSPELWERIMAEGDEMYRKGLEPSPDVCP